MNVNLDIVSMNYMSVMVSDFPAQLIYSVLIKLNELNRYR